MGETPRNEGRTESNSSNETRRRYWEANVRYLVILLAIWFTVSFVFGILLVEQLNRVTLPGSGYKLGFWFAQQGSLYVFIILIFYYARKMAALDREFHVDRD